MAAADLEPALKVKVKNDPVMASKHEEATKNKTQLEKVLQKSRDLIAVWENVTIDDSCDGILKSVDDMVSEQVNNHDGWKLYKKRATALLQ